MKVPPQQYLANYDLQGVILLRDIYANDADLRLAIVQLMPEFVYSDWKYKPVRDLWRHIQKEGGYP